MHADAARFSLPVEASARCFVTFPPPFTIDSVRAFLAAKGRACAHARNHPHLLVLGWEGFAAEPVCCATNELRTLVRDAASRNGIPAVRIGPSTGISDMRHFAPGAPFLVCSTVLGEASIPIVQMNMRSSETIRNPNERVRSIGEHADSCRLQVGWPRRLWIRPISTTS
jgi:hypothetical protein